MTKKPSQPEQNGEKENCQGGLHDKGGNQGKNSASVPPAKKGPLNKGEIKDTKQEAQPAGQNTAAAKESPGHWKRWWAIATFVPFVIAILLSIYFGSPGGYQPASLIKLFFLFLQVGFITAYFVRHNLKLPIIHLWATLIVLMLLSWIVPVLAHKSGIVLDMMDVSSELSTPLYLFISCLTASWILPRKGRIVVRVICAILIALYFIVQCTYIGYYEIAHTLISVNAMLALAQTNFSEAAEYLDVNVPLLFIVTAVACVVLLAFLVFRTSRFSFLKVPAISKKAKIIMVVLFVINLIICILSVGTTQVADISAETYETLKSFSEFQTIVAKRRHMKIGDPEILARLKAAPDGVYVMIIGESLTRDHMNVYGYPRNTTPFQNEASRDPNYIFFNHAYSSYTQTVQVLTEALTEKNQYNDMPLTDAYSMIDLARQAGFHTTWISNQSRFGIWDTPIGAIGSQCDDQYWINQYLGTNVVTKDYDTALVPYLQKVNPDNRRQLIVIHLMGSHVSYWDRYPKEFYHWPEDCSKPRSTAEVMTDEYDNSVLFNDYVLESIMNVAINQLHADAVVYMSDHGEQVTERPGHNADQFDFTMVHIPFWIYTSNAYRAERPEEVAEMEARRNMPFSNDLLYDTFMGMMGLTAAHYDPTADIFSPAFNKDITTLMTMYGNIMISDDQEQLGPSKEHDDEEWDEEHSAFQDFDWSTYEPVQLSEQPMPEVKNEGTSQEKQNNAS